MAIWPFGRKSRKPSTSTDAPVLVPIRAVTSPDMTKKEKEMIAAREANDLSVPALRRRPSRTQSQKRPRSTSRKLSKANAPSQRNLDKVESVPAIPTLPDERRKQLSEKSGANRSNQQATPVSSTTTTPAKGDKPPYYLQNAGSSSSLQPEKFQVVRQPPPLQGKRSAADSDLLRRKSSKRKTEDRAREQQIKTMSSPIPIPKRPASYQSSPLARDTRNFPGAMTRNLERPLSEISLPLAESMQSHTSFMSDHHAFKVSAFDSLSPRPTIRYSGNPKSPNGSLNPSRSSTRKEKDKPAVISEETVNTRKRIEHLADDMDAGSLREMMERDRRRHERKRKSENEKLQRKLEKRAAKQKEEDVRRQEEEDGRQDEATRADGERSADATPYKGGSQAEDRSRTPESWLRDPSKEYLSLENPFRDAVAGTSTSHLEDSSPVVDKTAISDFRPAQATRLSQASGSPSLSPIRHVPEASNVSQVSEPAPPPPVSPQPAPKFDLEPPPSDASNRLSTSWRNMFRRSDTKAKRESSDRDRVAASSDFSNTSRESVSRQMPPSAFTRIPTNTNQRSTTIKRTTSRFREDLPEFSTSPPDLPLQSTAETSSKREQDGLWPTVPLGGGKAEAVVVDDGKRLSDIHPAYRDEVALSRQTSLRATSPAEGASVANLSQSLASVDSEGSWLTGRPVKRLSQPQLLRETVSSSASPSVRRQPPRDAEKDDGIDDDDEEDEDGPGTPEGQKYIGTLVPPPPSQKLRSSPAEGKPEIPKRKRPFLGAVSPGVPASDDDDGDETSLRPRSVPGPSGNDQQEKWHSAVGKHPTIVRTGFGPRIKSREGLLNDYHEGVAPVRTTRVVAGPSSGGITEARHAEIEGGDDDAGSRKSHHRQSPSLASSSHSINTAEDDDDDDDDEQASPDTPEAPGSANVALGHGHRIHRATSVDVSKGHARHISAGSARLLDLPPRNSQEWKRLSSGTTGSGTPGESGISPRHSRQMIAGQGSSSPGFGPGPGSGSRIVVLGTPVPTAATSLTAAEEEAGAKAEGYGSGGGSGKE